MYRIKHSKGRTVAQCKFCKKDITWLKEGRKNVPVEYDGTVHECEEFKNSLKSIRQIERESLSADEIAKYELGINQKKK